MLVVGNKLEFPVSLVDESSGSTVLQQVSWGFTGQRSQEELSEGQDELLLRDKGINTSSLLSP